MKRHVIKRFINPVSEVIVYRPVIESGDPTTHCEYCKRAIYVMRPKKRFCSNTCKSKWYYIMKRDLDSGAAVLTNGAIKKCPVCSKAITRGTATYCSAECKEIKHAEKRKYKCRECGNQFESNRKNARFCTTECKTDYNNKIKRMAKAEIQNEIKLEKRAEILKGLKRKPKYDFL